MRGLVASLTAAREAASRRPGLIDAALAVALAALVTWEITTTDVSGPPGPLLGFGLLTTLPLAVRRRAPVAVAVAVCIGVLVLDQITEVQEPQTTLLPFLAAVYSVGAHAGRRTTGIGLACALITLLVDAPDDVVVMGPLTVAFWLLGRLVRSWRRQAADLSRLADALDRERAENARLAVADERTRIARELHDVVGHGSLMVFRRAPSGWPWAPPPATREASSDRAARPDDAGRAPPALRGAERSDDDETGAGTGSPGWSSSPLSSSTCASRPRRWTWRSASRGSCRRGWTFPPTGSCRKP